MNTYREDPVRLSILIIIRETTERISVEPYVMPLLEPLNSTRTLCSPNKFSPCMLVTFNVKQSFTQR
jgi:hypothetical protein